MWMREVTVLERVLRAAVGYGFLLVVLQNAMIGPDDSITGGLVGVVTIFVLNAAVAPSTFYSRRLEQLIDGQPTRLVHDGHVDEAAMAHELVTRAELHAALREAGLADVSEARFVMLEATGRMTVGPHR